jgi:hypothetical protein
MLLDFLEDCCERLGDQVLHLHQQHSRRVARRPQARTQPVREGLALHLMRQRYVCTDRGHEREGKEVTSYFLVDGIEYQHPGVVTENGQWVRRMFQVVDDVEVVENFINFNATPVNAMRWRPLDYHFVSDISPEERQELAKTNPGWL